MRICRVRVEEKEEFLVYTVLWTLTCHPYLESATALSDSMYMSCIFLPSYKKIIFRPQKLPHSSIMKQLVRGSKFNL